MRVVLETLNAACYNESFERAFQKHLCWILDAEVTPGFFAQAKESLDIFYDMMQPMILRGDGRREYRVTGFRGMVTNSTYTVYPQVEEVRKSFGTCQHGETFKSCEFCSQRD